MKKYTFILFPFLCFLSFYLFGDDEGIYLNFPSNASVIQSYAVESTCSTPDESISRNFTIYFQTRILQNSPEPVAHLPIEVEITPLDFQASEQPAKRGFANVGFDEEQMNVGFDEEQMCVPIRALIDGDGELNALEENQREIVDACDFSFHLTSALADKSLVQGQVIETIFGWPLKMTITKITEENIYVDLEAFEIFSGMTIAKIDEDENFYFIDNRYLETPHSGRCDSSYLIGKGVWKRDNALIHDITLEGQFMTGEHSLHSRFRSVSKQN